MPQCPAPAQPCSDFTVIDDGRLAKPIGAVSFQQSWDINKTEPVLSAFCQSNHAKIDEEVDYSNEQKCIVSVTD